MSEYRKAIIGGVIAGLTALATALADNTVTSLEWVGVAAAVAGAAGAVWLVPNATSDASRR